MAKTKVRASEYGIERTYTVDEMLLDKSIDIILNLTVPNAYASVALMALGITNNKPHRVNGELAYHVLDAMQGFLEASKSSKHIILQSACSVPARLPETFQEDVCKP